MVQSTRPNWRKIDRALQSALNPTPKNVYPSFTQNSKRKSTVNTQYFETPCRCMIIILYVYLGGRWLQGRGRGVLSWPLLSEFAGWMQAAFCVSAVLGLLDAGSWWRNQECARHRRRLPSLRNAARAKFARKRREILCGGPTRALLFCFSYSRKIYSIFSLLSRFRKKWEARLFGWEINILKPSWVDPMLFGLTADL